MAIVTQLSWERYLEMYCLSNNIDDLNLYLNYLSISIDDPNRNWLGAQSQNGSL